MIQNCLTHLLAYVDDTIRKHGSRGLRHKVKCRRIIASPQIEIMLKLANRNVIELPPTGIISTSIKQIEVLRRFYKVFKYKSLGTSQERLADILKQVAIIQT